jgi:hypothetical protein
MKTGIKKLALEMERSEETEKRLENATGQKIEHGVSASG